MTLSPGSRLGPYDIVAPLGAGGMGEVYRARDARLVREVAIKILPDPVATDSERLARFQREAQVLAALNHPHIASIYGLEETGGRRALVLELVEGETLAERIARGALPVEEALPIAIEIADALETAHERGIVHRDLKPANVMLTPEGRVKVLDFGLAKALTGESSSPDLASSPTLTAAATQAGVVIGTAAYMSPEQARGKSVDKRADLWAFGCVLYEMLSGKRAFEGETVSDTLAAILRAEPDFARLPDEAPARVRELLRRALQKDPRQRLRDAGDARLDLEQAAKEPRGPHTTTEGAMLEEKRPGWMRSLGRAGAAIAIALLAVAGLWVGRWTAPQPAVEVVRLEMPLAPADMLGPTRVFQRPYRPSFVVTPDGRRVVFAGVKGDTTQLYIRAFDAAEAVPLPGTSGADTPFVSPDGAWVGFLADGEIRKTRLAGGPIIKVADLRKGTLPSPNPLVPAAQDFFGASWGDDDAIVFGRFTDGLWHVPAAGGEPKRIIGGVARLPRVLPGGKGILFTLFSLAVGRPEDSVAVADGGGGEPRVLISSGSDARYLAPDRLLFARDGVLMTISFDLDRLAVAGTPTPLFEGILHAIGGTFPTLRTGAAQYDVTPSGTLVFAYGGVNPPQFSRLVWVERDGIRHPIDTPAGNYSCPRLSPDGRHLAVGFQAPSVREKGGIFTFDLARGGLSRLTADWGWGPLWTADRTEIYFHEPSLSRVRTDGSGSVEKVADGIKFPSSVSPDGSLLAFIENGQGTGSDIWLLPLRGDRTPRPWLKTPSNEAWAEFSPDGKFMAYGSDVSGRFEVYVQPFPGPGPRHQISLEGGNSPLWSKSGRELFFAVRDTKETRIMAADITTSGSAFSAARPRLLFAGPYPTTGAITAFDIAADGKRFLMVEALEPPKQPTTRLHVVLNWLEDVRRATR